MFYTKALIKQKALRFDLPGKIDEAFYLDIKKRLTDNPDFEFQTEANIWQLHRLLFIVFILTITSVIFLTVYLLMNFHKNIILFILPFAVIIVGLQPSIYFGILLGHYFIYRIKENRFHADFKHAIARSSGFEDFVTSFYIGRYAETTELQEYFYNDSIEIIKEFVQAKNLIKNITIYKFSKGDHYILLSNSIEVIQYIENHSACIRMEKNDTLRQVIKEQLEFPFVYGSKNLKHLID